MKRLDLSRYALSLSAAALLAACGGSQPSIGAPAALPQSRASDTKASSLPSTSQLDLLYVSAYTEPSKLPKTYVYDYASRTQLFTLSGVTDPGGVCVGKAANVFVLDDATPYAIVEYAHGATTPRRSLPVEERPLGCAVDLKSGDIAVTADDSRNFYVYKHGRGTPEVYSVPNVEALGDCGYDDRGTLFVTAWTQNSYGTRSYLYELRKGRDGVHIVRLKGLDHYFFDVKWDGSYVAILSEQSVYRLAIHGKHATLEQTVRLPNEVLFWVVPSYGQVVATDGSGLVEFAGYPSGSYIANLDVGAGNSAPAVSLAHPRS